ncbi:MAG: tRNA guanosine(34) transglycosylase Tgt [Candidatus Diapherotrites archaeon]
MFKIKKIEGKARSGVLKTAHGKIHTPLFMPVATKGSVKLLSMEELEGCGTEAFISNAFVLSLKPGVEVIEKKGGLHKFVGWEKGIFTDSGGFQLLSKEFLEKINDKGIWFRNPFNGARHFFTPRDCIELQNKLGSDVAMALDDVPHANAAKKRVAEAVERTTRWAKEFVEGNENKKQLVFCISQGGSFPDLRKKSIEELKGIDGFDGIGLGGLCIGEGREKMQRMVSVSTKLMPEEKPRYLMGVGTPSDLLEAIAAGVDVFDSCFPTRTARHGLALTSRGRMQIDRKKFQMDFRPLDEECGCFVCRNHSRAYIHHLFDAKEENGWKYLTFHNVFFMQNLVKEARKAIEEGAFQRFRKEMGKKQGI